MKGICIFFILFINHFDAAAQKSLDITFKNSTYVATDSLLPFWFTANQWGKIRNAGSLLNLTDLKVEQIYSETNSPVSYTWGVNIVAAFAETNYLQLNQAFAGALWKGWELKAGMFREPALYDGLSTTNGNLAQSQNARPYPEIRLATLDYRPVPYLQNLLGFKAEYSEGLLNDRRFVDNARLHHKSLYIRAYLSDTWKLDAGLEHFVLWGGISPEAGKLPSGIRDYMRYVLGTSGDEAFPETDQRNVAGNQLGTWQFRLQKQFPEVDVTFYLSHLFEELSGLKWRNWPDNLLGMHISFTDKGQLISGLVYEYTNTRQQSIAGTEDDPDPGNYFRHGIYRSSFTYHWQIMGSPLFFPLIMDEGVVRGLGSNRFNAHHIGFRGSLLHNFQWKGMLTYIRHLGLYTAPYNEPQKQFSGIFELHYSNPKIPLEFGTSVASDMGNSISRNSGLQFWVTKTF